MTTNGDNHVDVKVVQQFGDQCCLDFFIDDKLAWRDVGNVRDAHQRLAIAERFVDRFPICSRHQIDHELLIVTMTPLSKDADPIIISIGTLLDETGGRLRPYVIDGLLRSGETANIIADPKRGKSWLAYGLALSIVTGRDWIDAFPTSAGKVLLIDNELHPETIAYRIRAVAEALAIAPIDYRDHLDVLSLRGSLQNIMQLGRIIQRIEADAYRAVILDAYYRSIPAGTSENDNAGVAMIYNTIDRYADTMQAAWLLIHHATKGSQIDKAITDVGAGAGSQSRAADSHVILRPHEQPGHVVLEAAVRSSPPVDPLVLKWTFPLWERTDLDPKRLKRVLSRAEQRESAKDQEGIAKIIAALAKHQRGTTRRLMEWTGMSWERIAKLIVKLQDEGRVISDEVIVKGKPCGEHRLAPPKEGNVSDEF